MPPLTLRGAAAEVDKGDLLEHRTYAFLDLCHHSA